MGNSPSLKEREGEWSRRGKVKAERGGFMVKPRLPRKLREEWSLSGVPLGAQGGTVCS